MMVIHEQTSPHTRSHNAEFACLFPRLSEDTKVKETYQSIELDATAGQLVRSCCRLYGSKPTMVLATIWTVTLHSFTEGERVKFALLHKVPVHGVRCAEGGKEYVRAETYATLIDRETPARELMKQENWEILPHVGGDQLLNTGLYMGGETEEEFSTILKVA
ncbi:hypothetical protein IFM46972_10211 [Aspergillus udagawae]|uniref:Uncharacterized protein n=1 Tax=Aspergillus udagawae TaxID=91492 RepID=A0A8H3XNK0_9EURO|nr:uncharacterized protein Aud_007786 [Aspergillus udagawae]GFF55214.1 hypothetical protein IFM46972_10211 [Aspergillus udagawae]GIC91343.1 hypothetical protein Aud_007786 [Aspergillus udagawae]